MPSSGPNSDFQTQQYLGQLYLPDYYLFPLPKRLYGSRQHIQHPSSDPYIDNEHSSACLSHCPHSCYLLGIHSPKVAKTSPFISHSTTRERGLTYCSPRTPRTANFSARAALLPWDLTHSANATGKGEDGGSGSELHVAGVR